MNLAKRQGHLPMEFILKGKMHSIDQSSYWVIPSSNWMKVIC
jgi:hypothetical protein